MCLKGMMETNVSKLIAQNVTRSFGSGSKRTIAVDDVSLEIREGEFSLFMGPSGSGKSTLLAILSGLLRPDQGKVLAMDQDLWTLSEVDREEFRRRWCGFIFQGYNLYPSLTVQEQLEMVLRWGDDLPGHHARSRVSAMLERLGIQEQAHDCPNVLSGGEKQRVAIARALIKEPVLCFADEPTSSLDWNRGKEVVELLKKIAQEERAILFVVTHDSRILPYADRVFHLEDGRLSEEAVSSNSS